MNLATAAAVFAVIFPAELPDKSVIASIVLGSRYRPGLVWLGIAAAFTVHVTVAVAAGGVLSLLPRAGVAFGAATLFLVGAVVLWRESTRGEGTDEATAEAEIAAAERSRTGADAGDAAPSPRRVVTTGFVVIFLAEWGDLTQIVTATLAARYRDPLSVGVGALTALWTASAIGVTVGSALLRVVPVKVLQRVAAIVLVGLAVLTVVEQVT